MDVNFAKQTKVTIKRKLPTAERRLSSVLVTGGCGFIGANLIRYLARKGYKIRVLDNLSTGKKENLIIAESQSPIDLIVGDVRDKIAAENALTGMEAVVHLAAHTSVVESLNNPEENWDINANGTLNLLEACRGKETKKFIFVSSNAVLGEQSHLADETKLPKPISPYGASKLAGETLCSTYYQSFGLNTVCLRLSNCYGPYSEHKDTVINQFINRARDGKSIVIYGDGNQTRDFIHVDDVCRAIHICLVTDIQISGEIFQIGSGVETSVSELAEMIKAIMREDILIIHKAKRKGEIDRNYSDIGKAGRLLGFQPEIKIRDGIEKLCA